MGPQNPPYLSILAHPPQPLPALRPPLPLVLRPLPLSPWNVDGWSTLEGVPNPSFYVRRSRLVSWPSRPGRWGNCRLWMPYLWWGDGLRLVMLTVKGWYCLWDCFRQACCFNEVDTEIWRCTRKVSLPRAKLKMRGDVAALNIHTLRATKKKSAWRKIGTEFVGRRGSLLEIFLSKRGGKILKHKM